MNKYNLCTGYVETEELEEIANETELVAGAAFTSVACAVVTLTALIVTEVACPSKACTGYCN